MVLLEGMGGEQLALMESVGLLVYWASLWLRDGCRCGVLVIGAGGGCGSVVLMTFGWGELEPDSLFGTWTVVLLPGPVVVVVVVVVTVVAVTVFPV